MVAYDFKEVEERILGFWDKHKVLDKLRARNKGKKKFYFLQGPPFTSGKLHMGHAWNNGLKDVVLRLKRMQGFDVWDRAGYDMHGLPTELKVMKKLNLKFKEDILKHGLASFNDECRRFSVEMMGHMDTDLRRMGVTMDFSDSYRPIDNYFMESEWGLIKRAHENGRLYLGERTLSWCADCASALAKHEQEYKTVKDRSIFVRMRLRDAGDEFFVIWTTTPWTIPFNLAIMVNPELEYQRCEITAGEHKGEIWWVSKALAGAFIKSVMGADFKVLSTCKGRELEGKAYVHPFSSLYNLYDAIGAKKLHTVLLSHEYVDTSAGTGLVHCAPGCGPEDYEVGYRNGLPAYNVIDEKGIFPVEAGPFSGKRAKADDEVFTRALEEQGALLASTMVEHEYPHCWRHSTPVVFRTTKQWFLRTQDLREKIIKENKDVRWVPKQAQEMFDAWIANLRDNSITKQRFWGTPAPIWVNEQDESDYLVIGSAAELASYVGKEKVPKDLHLPYINEVVITKEGRTYRRIPDVLDVWLDSGTASWSCLYNDEKLMERWYPADFILEAKEQIRLWFYMLAICADLKGLPAFPFRHVYCHGMLTSVDGVKMSKSLGNVISPYEIIDKHGADTMRYYLCSIRAGSNVSFSWDEVTQKYRNLNVLWNMHSYVIDLFKVNGFSVHEVLSAKHAFKVQERYALSLMHRAKQQVLLHLDAYELDDAVQVIEEAYLSLSRDYIKMVRDNVAQGTIKQKQAIAYVLYTSLLDTLKIMQLYVPFICEEMYQHLKRDFGAPLQESVMEESFVEYDESCIDALLLDEVGLAMQIITAVLACREKAKRGVRWPVKAVRVISEHAKDLRADLIDVIKTMTNVKEITFADTFDFTYEIKPNAKGIAPVFGQKTGEIISLISKERDALIAALKGRRKELALRDAVIVLDTMLDIQVRVQEPYVLSSLRSGYVVMDTTRSRELEAEGYLRELARRVQDERKKLGLSKDERIDLYIGVQDESWLPDLKPFGEELRQKVGAKNLSLTGMSSFKKDASSVEHAVRKMQFMFSFSVV